MGVEVVVEVGMPVLTAVYALTDLKRMGPWPCWEMLAQMEMYQLFTSPRPALLQFQTSSPSQSTKLTVDFYQTPSMVELS
jgi:hypothetical protein